MKRYRIVDKRRFYLFVTFILVISGVFILNFVFNKGAHSSILQEPYLEIQVEQGDTIWTIAARNIPSKYDIREMVYNIKNMNQIETSFIYPGEIIKVPIIQ